MHKQAMDGLMMIPEMHDVGVSLKDRHQPDFGYIPGLPECFGTAFSLEMYRRGNFVRQFEYKVKEAYDRKVFQIPIYLAVGQEFNAAAYSMVLPGVNIFAQHRAHGIYLAFGGVPERLRDELLGLSSGCSGGMSGSNAIQAPEINMFGHSGLMGEQVAIAVGAAMASGQPTLTVCGDASVEEDYIYPSLGYAASKKLPVLFVCEDNGLSILTPIETRRTWSAVDVARSLGMPAVDIADDPWLIAHHIQNMMKNLPGFINIQTVRNLWHAGTGMDGPPEWDRYQLVKTEMGRLGLSEDVKKIEQDNLQRVERLWDKQLPKL
jgi:acetoin:2,6-dichlorophenolindophenol oxidoreductase subunit alpha